jgi:hypothetical protein
MIQSATHSCQPTHLHTSDNHKSNPNNLPTCTIGDFQHPQQETKYIHFPPHYHTREYSYRWTSHHYQNYHRSTSMRHTSNPDTSKEQANGKREASFSTNYWNTEKTVTNSNKTRNDYRHYTPPERTPKSNMHKQPHATAHKGPHNIQPNMYHPRCRITNHLTT